MDTDALEQRARSLIEPMAYDYFAAGSDDEITARDNVEAWRRIRFLPHVLRDVSSVSTSAHLFGTDLPAPILIAPMAAQRLAHPEGERAMARAAAEAGTVMIVSTMATVAMEEVAAAAPGAPRWFQFYVHRDREMSADLVRRAADAGYEAVVLTVDLPVLGRRRKDEINRFELPEGMQMENLAVSIDSMHGSGLGEYSDAAFDPSLTFDDIEWVRSIADLPVIVKGVMRPDDADSCVAAGADAIVVSNHGGRQLDGVVATADALPPIVDAVAGRVPVLVDGGIRGGYDVARALCLGADAVLVGRPLLWGLAVGGARGAQAVLDELKSELTRSMALLGVTSVGDLDRSLLVSVART
jgi:4-hydroxymandelate oxidase